MLEFQRGPHHTALIQKIEAAFDFITLLKKFATTSFENKDGPTLDALQDQIRKSGGKEPLLFSLFLPIIHICDMLISSSESMQEKPEAAPDIPYITQARFFSYQTARCELNLLTQLVDAALQHANALKESAPADTAKTRDTYQTLPNGLIDLKDYFTQLFTRVDENMNSQREEEELKRSSELHERLKDHFKSESEEYRKEFVWPTSDEIDEGTSNNEDSDAHSENRSIFNLEEDASWSEQPDSPDPQDLSHLDENFVDLHCVVTTAIEEQKNRDAKLAPLLTELAEENKKIELTYEAKSRKLPYAIWEVMHYYVITSRTTTTDAEREEEYLQCFLAIACYRVFTAATFEEKMEAYEYLTAHQQHFTPELNTAFTEAKEHYTKEHYRFAYLQVFTTPDIDKKEKAYRFLASNQSSIPHELKQISSAAEEYMKPIATHTKRASTTFSIGVGLGTGTVLAGAIVLTCLAAIPIVGWILLAAGALAVGVGLLASTAISGYATRQAAAAVTTAPFAKTIQSLKEIELTQRALPSPATP